MNPEFRWKETDKTIMNESDVPPHAVWMNGANYHGWYVLQVRCIDPIYADNGPFDPSVIGTKMGEWTDVEMEKSDE